MDIPGLPQIPTDNLYKFQAVSGVVMVTVGFVLLAWVFWEVDTSNGEMAAHRAMTARAVQRFERDAQQLESLTTAGAGVERLKRQTQLVDSLQAVSDRMTDVQHADFARIEWGLCWVSLRELLLVC